MTNNQYNHLRVVLLYVTFNEQFVKLPSNLRVFYEKDYFVGFGRFNWWMWEH